MNAALRAKVRGIPVSIEDYFALEVEVHDLVESHRDAIEAGSVVLLRDGTLVSRRHFDSDAHLENELNAAEDRVNDLREALGLDPVAW